MVDEYLKRKIKGRLRTALEIEHRLRRTLEPVMNRKASEIKKDGICANSSTPSPTRDWSGNQDIESRQSARCLVGPWLRTSSKTIQAKGSVRMAPSAPRDRVLSDDEIRVLWQWFDDTRNIASKVSNILKL
jgi:hypothetical protein